MIFDADNDFGPYETLFGAFDGYTIQLRADRALGDVRIDAAHRDRVTVTRFQDGDEDEPTGETLDVEYANIVEVVVY